MCKRVQTAPEGQEGLKAPQVHSPEVSPLKEDAAPGGLPQKSSPERAAEYSKICFFLLTLFQSSYERLNFKCCLQKNRKKVDNQQKMIQKGVLLSCSYSRSVMLLPKATPDKCPSRCLLS